MYTNPQLGRVACYPDGDPQVRDPASEPWPAADVEHHGEAWEEFLCLSGDTCFAGRGVGLAGTVINDPGFHEHGPYTTQRGHLAITQTLQPLPMHLRDDTEGPRLLDGHRAVAPVLDPGRPGRLAP